MNPMQYYYLMRKKMEYRPPLAALATLARFCNHDDYWVRVQKISDWMNGRLVDAEHAVLCNDEDSWVPHGHVNLSERDICSSCGNMLFVDWLNRTCSLERAKGWPGRTNGDGDIIACPSYLPEARGDM